MGWRRFVAPPVEMRDAPHIDAPRDSLSVPTKSSQTKDQVTSQELSKPAAKKKGWWFGTASLTALQGLGLTAVMASGMAWLANQATRVSAAATGFGQLATVLTAAVVGAAAGLVATGVLTWKSLRRGMFVQDKPGFFRKIWSALTQGGTIGRVIGGTVLAAQGAILGYSLLPTFVDIASPTLSIAAQIGVGLAAGIVGFRHGTFTGRFAGWIAGAVTLPFRAAAGFAKWVGKRLGIAT